MQVRQNSIQMDLNNKENLLSQMPKNFRSNTFRHGLIRTPALFVICSLDSSPFRCVGFVFRPTSLKESGWQSPAIKTTFFLLDLRSERENVFFPSHRAKALSPTVVRLT